MCDYLIFNISTQLFVQGKKSKPNPEQKGKRRIAPPMVTYHYVKFYVSIIIQLEVIYINVRNFKFPIGFHSNPHRLWTPKNMALTPFTTNLKTLGSTRNTA
jgi:hypothetical protein